MGWDRWYGRIHAPPSRLYGDNVEATVRAAEFLDTPEVSLIEDWGCGWCGFRDCISPHQEYRGVDFSTISGADIVANLEDYRSDVDAIFMRGVLIHNSSWAKILDNALASFTQRMVLVVSKGFEEVTQVTMRRRDWVVLGFRKEDITDRLKGFKFRLEDEPDREKIFYIER